MLKSLPSTPQELLAWQWPDIEPHCRALETYPLNAGNVHDILQQAVGLMENTIAELAKVSD